MTASYWAQIKLNLWKSWLVRKKKPVLWTFEVLSPLIMVSIVGLMHLGWGPSQLDTCYFRSRANPSAGNLPYLQSSLCNIINRCRPEDTFEDVPTYLGSKLPDLVQYGSPIFYDDNILAGIESLEVMVKILDGAAETFNTTFWQTVLDDQSKVREWFNEPERIADFLETQSQTMDQDLADFFLNSTLRLSTVINQIDLLGAQTTACNSELLSKYIITHDALAIQEFSDGLCNLSDDQVVDFIEVLHHNLDLDNIFRTIGHHVELLINYDVYAGLRDLATVEGSIVNITDIVGHVEPIFHFDFWMEEFTKLIRSILENENPYSWEIMDRWAELTLGIYLEPSFYEDILLYVNELTNVLEEVNQDFYSDGQGNFTIFSEHKMSPYVMKEEARGPWESLAVALEHLIRNMLENEMKCANDIGLSCQQQQTSVNIAQSILKKGFLILSKGPSDVNAYDYLDYFLTGLVNEFESGYSFILSCILNFQPIIDTSIMTYSNVLVFGNYLRHGWPSLAQCSNEFEDYFHPPSFVDIESLSKTICSLNALIKGEIQWDSGIEDPLISTIVDMINGDVPRSNTTSDALVEKIELIISDGIGYPWPTWNSFEFDETIEVAETNLQDFTYYDIFELIQDLLNFAERLIGNDEFFNYTNATIATQNEVLKLAMEFTIDALENMDQEYIYISISDFLVGFDSLDEFVESVAETIPYVANSWSDLLLNEQFENITNGIYALVLDPEYNICQGNASIRDVWDFPIEADPFIDKFEAGVCDFDGVLDELNNSSFFQKLDNIWSTPNFQFEWAEAGERSEMFVSQVIELANASETRTVVIDYVDEDFNRAVLNFLDNAWVYWKGLFHSEFDILSGNVNSNQDVVHCLTIDLPCLNSQIGRFTKFVSRFISDFEAQTGFLSTLEQDGGYLYTRIVPQIVIVGSLRDFLQTDLTEDDLIVRLMDSGLSEDAALTMANSYLNLNRVYFASQNPGTLTQNTIEDNQKFARVFKFGNATIYERIHAEIERANVSQIALTLEEFISVDKVVTSIETMRRDQFEDFTWIKSFIGLSNGIVNDVKDLIFHVRYLIRTLANAEMEQDLIRSLLQILKQESIGEVLDSLFGLINGVELLIGNTKVSNHMDQIREALEGLEFIQALRGLQFQLEVQSLFDPWDMVEGHLEQELNITAQSVQSLAQSYLDLPKLVLGNSGHSNNTIIDYVCDSTLLDDYLDPPLDFSETDWDITDVSTGLCNMTAGQSLNLTIIMIEEIDIEDFLREFLSLSLSNILGPQNITESMGEKALNAFFEATTILSRDYMDDINHLVDSFEDLFNDTSMSALNFAGVVACGDPYNFNINLDIPGSNGDEDEDEGNEWVPPPIADQCTNFREALSKIKGGSIIWTTIASFFQGQIIYTPSNSFTDSLVKEMNISYYKEIEKFQKNVRVFLTIADRAEELSMIPDDFAVYDFLIHSPVFKALINNLFPTFDLELLEDLNLLEIISSLVDYESVWKTVQTVRYAVECYHLDRFAPASSEEELERMALTQSNNQSFQAGIVFLGQAEDEDALYTEADETPKHVKYKIRMSRSSVPTTNQIKDTLWVPGPDDNYFLDLKYLRGFIQLQDLVDRAILSVTSQFTNSTDLSNVGVYTQQFPYPCFERDNYLSGVYTVQVMQICFFLGYAITLASTVRFQVWEKESQNLEVMQVMGMRRSIPWIVWLIISGATMILSSILLTILLKVSGVLPRTNPFLLFALLLFYVLSLLGYCLILAVILNTALVATVVSVLLYIASFLPFVILLLVETNGLWLKIIANLFMSSSFSYGALYLTRYEQQAIGLHWDNMWASPLGDKDNWNFGIACCFVLLGAILYSVVAIFILWWQRKSWNNQKIENGTQGFSVPGENRTNEQRERNKVKDKIIGISMKNITKDFPMLKNKTKRAVNNLTMDLYEGEITVLLGDNGAGKSTTMKLLTGMESLTSGNIEICGYSYPDEWAQIQSKIGFCPQQSVLFPDLSTREHLQFYGKLKGIHNPVELETAVNDLIEAMNIGAAQHEPVRNLSEGNQRRVCISLAFIGGSKVVILDEPTSGVDPIARRYIWDLITRFKHERTILMTTHHLDEAEILSDRIAIIHKGELMTDGSLSSLKRQFGDGMKLTITWNNNPRLQETRNHLLSKFWSMLPNAKYYNNTVESNEQFFIPYSQHIMPKGLCQFLAILEKQIEQRQVVSFNLEGTTLEDIFLSFVMGSREHVNNPLNSSDTPSSRPTTSRWRQGPLSAPSTTEAPKHLGLRTGWPLVLGQARGLLYKRFKHSTRDWRFLMSSLGLPTLMVILTMFLALMRPSGESPPLLLTPSIFGENSNSFVSFSEESNLNSILQSLVSDPGLGTTCMADVPDLGLWTPCDPIMGEANFSTEYEGPGSKLTQCSCPSSYEWTCQLDSNSSLSRAPRMIMNTTDVIFDLTDQPSPSHWILNSHTQFIDKRFGGWSIGEPSPSSEVIGGTTENLIVWYNNKGVHAVPSYLNAIHNAMLRTTVAESEQDPTQFGITTYNHPLLLNAKEATTATIIQSVADIGIALMMLTSFSFVPSSFISYVITERIQREKQVQIVAGVSPLTYWCSTFIWDLGVILIYTIVTGIVLQIFKIGSYTDKSNFSAVLVLMFFFCTASTSIVYCIEKWFSEPSLGQLTVLCSNVLLGILLLMIIILLDMLYAIKATMGLGRLRRFLNVIFRFAPAYSLGGGLLALATNYITGEVLESAMYDEDGYKPPFSFDVIGLNILILALETIFFFGLNLVVEYKLLADWCPWWTSPLPQVDSEMTQEDSDVKRERQRVESQQHHPFSYPNVQKPDLLRIKNLSKAFVNGNQTKLAVNNVSVGIKYGECFGWIGLNGAGKSTTFKVLTGEIQPSAGEYQLNPPDTLRGYCPQENALDPLLTVRETLQVYCQVRGLSPQDSRKAIDHSIVDLALDTQGNTMCKDLSGGTKRKVCAAVAFLGQPKLILMDEPTSGMDAGTKRQVWKIIQREVEKGTTVILTTHSMEECEQLCSRLTIMAEGQLKCIGSPQHVKKKFGQGYKVQLSFDSLFLAQKALRVLRSMFNRITNVSQHYTNLSFNIPDLPQSEIFARIVPRQKALGITNLNVASTTLDEVFVGFATKPKKQSHEC